MNNKLIKIPILPPVVSLSTTTGLNLIDRALEAWTISRKCRVEIERLRVQERQFNQQIKLAHTKLEYDHRIQLKKIKAERKNFEAKLKIVIKGLDQMHFERMGILKLAIQAQQSGNIALATQCMHVLTITHTESITALKLLESSSEITPKQLEI